ncbi:hypothetical protein AB7942_15030 [Neobacillus sp. BF23-41]
MENHWFLLFGIILLVIASLGYQYYQLQPKNHLTSVPAVSSRDNKKH